MKRVNPNASLGFPAESVHRAFTRSQLAEVGAVVLAWNHLELYLDNTVGFGLGIPDEVQHEVVGRIHGIDGKIALVRLMTGPTWMAISKAPRERIDLTMSAVGEHKTYRDAVAHARAVSRKVSHIVETSGARGKISDLLFTPEALALLARRIEAIQKEVGDIAMLFNYQTAILRLTDSNRGGSYDLDIRELERDFQRHAAQLRRHQKRRLSLPPLPAFPKKHQAR